MVQSHTQSVCVLDSTILVVLAVLLCTSTLVLMLTHPGILTLTLNLALIELHTQHTHTHTQTQTWLHVKLALTSGGRKLAHCAQAADLQTCKVWAVSPRDWVQSCP